MLRTAGLAALGAVLCAPLHAQLRVVSVSPAPHDTAAPTATSIVLQFDAAVDRASVDASTLRVFGDWSGVRGGAITFADGDRRVTLQPARPFFPGERVTVAAAASIRAATGGATLDDGARCAFWTASSPGTGQFTNVATLPVRQKGEFFIQTYGAYAGDLDRDGAPDLSLPNEFTSDVRVMRNDGCGAFAPPQLHQLPVGGRPSSNAGQDFNNDGWIDLAVASITGNEMSILMGDGAGSYAPAVTYPAGTQARGLTVLDADGDGDFDVVTAHRVSSDLALFRNAGDGTFGAAEFFEGGGVGETAVAAADANGDRLADLFVGNFSSNTVTLLLNQGNGVFALAATQSVPTGPWMLVTGDMDRDGAVDAITCCSGAARVAVVRGDGAGGLLPAATYTVGTSPLAVDVGDLNGDGALDLVASNLASDSFTAYFNRGDGVLQNPITLPAVQAGSCALIVDHDRDGDMDIIGIDEFADLVLVFAQDDAPAPGLQPMRGCGAALRLDNLGSFAGYGGRALHVVPVGGVFHVGLSGEAGAAFGVLLGVGTPAGIPLRFGLFHLGATPLATIAAGTLDAFGEVEFAVPVDAALPAGLSVALQGAAVIAGPGLTLSNPERLVLQ
ncbi:MAG: FG-GAP-like repeat-containing protein [Planctomycetota bacterium]